MIYIEYTSENIVTTQHFCPFDKIHGLGKTEEELLKTGALIDTVPEPEDIEGKMYVLKYDKESNTVYPKYEDIPKTEEDEIEILKKQVADLYFMQLQGGTN